MKGHTYTKNDVGVDRVNPGHELSGCLVVSGPAWARPITFLEGAARDNVAAYVRGLNDRASWVRWQ